MKNKKTNVIYRICCLSKQKYNRDLLIKITKVNNQIYLNDKNIKGRSIYFLKNNANQNNINKLIKIISNKLKLKINETDINKIKQLIK